MKIRETIRRAIKHGFDLSSIPNYTPNKFRNGLYDYLIKNHYAVFEEEGVIIVGYDLTSDILEIYISDTTMKVVPLSDVGFFEILLDLFKYIAIAAKEQNQDEISTESINEKDSESSGELWL
tara:strand:- start:435 stop:800 length:366 start_codon:yes stop_codon:yes gene_type:complete